MFPFIKFYGMSLLSDGSISLDSTFKDANYKCSKAGARLEDAILECNFEQGKG
jgi:hypothetical protein